MDRDIDSARETIKDYSAYIDGELEITLPEKYELGKAKGFIQAYKQGQARSKKLIQRIGKELSDEGCSCPEESAQEGADGEERCLAHRIQDILDEISKEHVR